MLLQKLKVDDSSVVLRYSVIILRHSLGHRSVLMMTLDSVQPHTKKVIKSFPDKLHSRDIDTNLRRKLW